MINKEGAFRYMLDKITNKPFVYETLISVVAFLIQYFRLFSNFIYTLLVRFRILWTGLAVNATKESASKKLHFVVVKKTKTKQNKTKVIETKHIKDINS